MCSSWHPQQCIVGIMKLESRPNRDAPPVAALGPDSGGIQGQVSGTSVRRSRQQRDISSDIK